MRKFTAQQAQKVDCQVGLIQSHGAAHGVETYFELEVLIRSLREGFFQQRHGVGAVPRFGKLRAVVGHRGRVRCRRGLPSDLRLCRCGNQCKKKTRENSS